MLGHVAPSVGGGAMGAIASRALDLASRQTTVYTPGSYTWTAPADGIVLAGIKGGGGTGFKVPSGSAAGAGGAGYTRKQFPVVKGQQVSITIAAVKAFPAATSAVGIDGNPSTLTTTDVSLIAEGGKGPATSDAGGAGGTGIGGDVNRSGGFGGAALAGSAGQDGFSGGARSSGSGGGGGAAGDPNDEFDALLPAGNGGQGQFGAAVGGAGGGQGGYANYSSSVPSSPGAGFLIFQGYLP